MDNPLSPHLPDASPLFRSTKRPAQPGSSPEDSRAARPDPDQEAPEQLEVSPGLGADENDEDDDNPLRHYATD